MQETLGQYFEKDGAASNSESPAEGDRPVEKDEMDKTEGFGKWNSDD